MMENRFEFDDLGNEHFEFLLENPVREELYDYIVNK